MTPFTLSQPDKQPKRSQHYILQDLVNQTQVHTVLRVIESPPVPNFLGYTTPFISCTKLHLSPNGLVWPSLALLLCLKWLYWTSGPPHVQPCFSLGSDPATGRKAFCIHTCLHSHSTHFVNTTRHPYSRTPYSLPHKEYRPLCVCEEMDSHQQVSHTEGIELNQFFLKSFLFKISFIDSRQS